MSSSKILYLGLIEETPVQKMKLAGVRRYTDARRWEVVPLPANASAVGFSATPQSCNTFEDTDAVNPSPAAPLPFDGKSLRFELPPASVVSVTLQP